MGAHRGTMTGSSGRLPSGTGTPLWMLTEPENDVVAFGALRMNQLCCELELALADVAAVASIAQDTE